MSNNNDHFRDYDDELESELGTDFKKLRLKCPCGREGIIETRIADLRSDGSITPATVIFCDCGDYMIVAPRRSGAVAAWRALQRDALIASLKY
jgi:hypothetical protein